MLTATFTGTFWNHRVCDFCEQPFHGFSWQINSGDVDGEFCSHECVERQIENINEKAYVNATTPRE